MLSVYNCTYTHLEIDVVTICQTNCIHLYSRCDLVTCRLFFVGAGVFLRLSCLDYLVEVFFFLLVTAHFRLTSSSWGVCFVRWRGKTTRKRLKILFTWILRRCWVNFKWYAVNPLKVSTVELINALNEGWAFFTRCGRWFKFCGLSFVTILTRFLLYHFKRWIFSIEWSGN